MAINFFDHAGAGLIAEVKKNPDRINLHSLHEKAEALPKIQFAHYQFVFKGLSLLNM